VYQLLTPSAGVAFFGHDNLDVGPLEKEAGTPAIGTFTRNLAGN
jgi:hypothetical protein